MNKEDRFGLLGNTIAETFRVDSVVAEGGFGVVYKAYHLHFRAPVALKCLKIPGELSEGERKIFLEQFRSEAEVQFRLSSQLPHILRPLHVDAVQTKDGQFVPMMALEWLEGQSFEQLIEERVNAGSPPMSLAEAMRLIRPVAEALHQAHSFEFDGEKISVIHRDVKPDNLFLTQVGGKPFVKLLDFGISKVRRAANQLAGSFSQTDGKAPFSPAYGAPEQWVPKRLGQTGPWTDVWGLALTLVEIIKGDVVVSGDHQEMMGTVLDAITRPSPRNEGVTVSDEVESVFLKALSLDPRFRHQSVDSFWQSLEFAIHESEGLTSAPVPWGRSEPPAAYTQPPLTHLPAMLAPAQVKRTHVEDLPVDSDPSYPNNPAGELKPVSAAPTSWELFDPEIPPSSGNTEGSNPEASASRLRAAAKLLPKAEESPELREAPGAPEPFFQPSVDLELQMTSSFPQHPWSHKGTLCPDEAVQESTQNTDISDAPPVHDAGKADSRVVSKDKKDDSGEHSATLPLSLIPAPGRKAGS